MASNSRRKRRLPHPTVVPAFVMLASTAAVTEASAGTTWAAAETLAHQGTAAFASSTTRVRSDAPRERGGSSSASGSASAAGRGLTAARRSSSAAASARRRHSAILLLSSPSSSTCSLPFFKSGMGFGVAAEAVRKAASPIAVAGWRKGGVGAAIGVARERLFGGASLASTSRHAGPGEKPSSPSPASDGSKRTPALLSDDGLGDGGGDNAGGRNGAGSAAAAAAAAAVAAGVAYSALCPALDGADDRVPFSAAADASRPRERQPQQRRFDSDRGLLEETGGGEAETAGSGDRQRVALSPPLLQQEGSRVTRDGSDSLLPGDEASDRRRGVRPGLQQREQRAAGEMSVGRNAERSIGGAAAAGAGAGARSNAQVRETAVRGVVVAAAPPPRTPNAMGAFGGVALDPAVARSEGTRLASLAVAERDSVPEGGEGGGDNFGPGSGRKRMTRKRQRNGTAAFTSAEDKALRELLTEAIKTGKGGAALRALRLMVEEKLPVSQKQFVGAMEACMRQGSWTSGLEVFRLLLEDLRPRGLSPKQSTWRSLARGLRSAGQADQGLAVLRQALAGGVQGIDEQVCSILLDLCAVKGRMGLAEEIASLMETHRIPKGPVTYCVLLKGYGRQRRLRGVEATMREIKAKGVVLDVVALNAAVDAFVRCGELPRARKILRYMEQSPGGSIAQTLTYNTLIKGLGRELRTDEAFEVARDMLGKGCFPDEVTTNSLVDICVRSGNLDRAYQLLKNPTLLPASVPSPTTRLAAGADSASGGDAEETAAGTPPGGSTATPTMVAGKSDPERGVRDMGVGGEGAGGGVRLVRPSVEAFTSVLTGFAGVGDKDRALAVFQQMVTAGVEPNLVTYTGLISACVNAGDMEGARRLFSALEARSTAAPEMQPSVFTYNTLIRGLCRMGVGSDTDTDHSDTSSTSTERDRSAEGKGGAANGERDEEITIGVYTDEDVLPPLAGEDERTTRIISKPGYFYERDPAVDTPPAAAAGKGGVSGAADDDVAVGGGGGGGGGSPRGGGGVEVSPGVESPPGIMPGRGSDGLNGSESGSGLPEGIQEALRVLLSMRRKGVPADEVTMNSIIDGLVSCSPPRIREAETVLTLMTGWGLKPNQVSFTVMLKGYGRAGDLGAAELMFELMAADRDQRPDVVALNSILDACVRNGDLRRAVEILEQAIAASLSKRAISIRRQDWVSSSSSRRPWGANASSGAVALCVAAAPGTGIGLDISDERERVKSRSVGVTGPGRGRGRDEGVVVDVRPNQVSFATVVLGLSRRGDAPAGRKAIKLYESMRREFKFVPDEAMVDSLIVACCNAQAEQVDGNDLALAQGQEALNDLRDLGWDEELIAFKEQVLLRVVPTLSEVWKEEDLQQQLQRQRRSSPRLTGKAAQQQQQQQGEGGKAGANRKRKVSAEIFEKYGWNKMESHFPIL